jgi:hypothetical protein
MRIRTLLVLLPAHVSAMSTKQPSRGLCVHQTMLCASLKQTYRLRPRKRTTCPTLFPSTQGTKQNTYNCKQTAITCCPFYQQAVTSACNPESADVTTGALRLHQSRQPACGSTPACCCTRTARLCDGCIRMLAARNACRTSLPCNGCMVSSRSCSARSRSAHRWTCNAWLQH